MPRLYGSRKAHIYVFNIQQIDLYASMLVNKVLPGFDHIDEEARHLENETYQRLLSRSSKEDPDIALLADIATEEAVDYLSMMKRMKQAQINLFTLGLYHLFEQQLFEIHRRVGFSFGLVGSTDEIELKEVTDMLRSDGVDIEKFSAWRKVQELSWVANCAKHGEGRSCQNVRKLRPDLLTRPSWEGNVTAWASPDPVVLNPLGGEHLYLSLQDFKEYVSSLTSFWCEFMAAVTE
jgi:hypothetical protein